MQPTVQCPLCSSYKVILFHDRVWSCAEGKVYRCSQCDVTFIYPMLSDAEEQSLYKNYNEYVAKRWDAPTAAPEIFHEARRAACDARFTFIKDVFRGRDSVLEIGCATGGFLELLSGKKCFGVEPGDANRQYGKKYAQEVYADLRDVPPELQFDCICMFHVFEHIREPHVFLNECKRHLHHDSIMILEIPHIDDPLISLYNCAAYKDFYFQPIHPFVYSVFSLEYVFSTAGFASYEVLYYQRYGLDNHLTWLAYGKPGGDAILSELFAHDHFYREKLQEIKKTDTIFYIARQR